FGDARVEYHCHAENIGTFANFSHGLDAVSTTYFSFLSDDDVLLPDFYKTAVEQLEPYPEAAFWGGTTIIMTEEGTIKDVTDWPAAYYTPPDGLLAMIENNHMIWTSVLFRTDKVRSIGGLDPEVGAPIDTDYMLRLAARLPYMTSPAPAAIWMSHPESSTVLADPGFIWPGWLKTVRNITEDESIAAEVRANVGRSLIDQLKRQLFQIGYNSIRQKKFDDARHVAGILRDRYDEPAKANLLAGMAWTFRHVPPAHPMVALLDRLRGATRSAARARSKDLQHRFGDYARFIAVPDPLQKNPLQRP
ncbi:MAG: glycosyltransferase, partial [Pseudomonadota bacterium]|nr:glycosyltransferase [Pseudomonadota bacterium]